MTNINDGRQGASSIPVHIAILSDHLRGLVGQGGGVDRCQWRLATEYASRGYRVDLVVFNAEGIDPSRLPTNIDLVVIPKSNGIASKLAALRCDPRGWRLLLRPILLPPRPSSRLRYLPGLISYLRASRPDLLISAGTYENLVSVLAVLGAGSSTRILVSERNPLEQRLQREKHRKAWRWRYLPPVLSYYYQRATRVIAISNELSEDIRENLHIPHDCVHVVYNPVIDQTSLSRMREPVDHPWLKDDAVPVLLAVGRLRDEKDFPTLLRAFRSARSRQPMRLIILGDGPDRKKLEDLIRELELSEHVCLAGYQHNPLNYMAHANVLVLSSLYEGLPAVLIEALAAGCPVISTDCPGSSAEILCHGRYGQLVPVGDPKAMSEAILETLKHPPQPSLLRERGREFSVERTADGYLEAAGFPVTGESERAKGRCD